MVNTRSKTGVLKSVSGHKTAPTKRSTPSSDADRKKGSSVPYHAEEPDLKRRRITDAEAIMARDQTVREPADGTLEALPMDIVLEIISHLHPLDLVQLARTSKIFRGLLMSKRSQNIWRKARSALNINVPECPPDQSEPQWAILLFDPACPMCNASHSTRVEWGLRVRGCKNCLGEVLVFGSAIPRHYPGINDMEKILDLLPFAYQRKWSWRGPRPPRSTKRLQRQYYRPAIQPMIDLYQSFKKQVLAKAPDARELFADLVAERKRIVNDILGAEGPMKNWGDGQLRLREQMAREEIQRWQRLYKEKLIAMGHDQADASRAVIQPPTKTKLGDGWEKNQKFFEKVASRMKQHRVARERSPIFHTLCQAFLAQSDKKPPIRGLWPSPTQIFDAIPQFKTILQTSETELYQAELKQLFPTMLDRWWETRKEILADKIFQFNQQQPASEDVKGDHRSPSRDDLLKRDCVPSFTLSHASGSGPPRLAILDLAKAVFGCSCRSAGWLEKCPIYWGESLVNHNCIRGRNAYLERRPVNLTELKFDALASQQVGVVCAALGLDGDQTRFTELDDLDARFRCVGCPLKKEIMNWRVAIKHQHNKGRASQRFPPTFAKIPDAEAAIVRAFELDNPDTSCPLGRIRSPLCYKAFYTTNELLDYLKDEYNVTELAPDGFWIDPSIPPEPVLETDVFED